MKSLILASVLALSGCVYQSVNTDDIAAATKKCTEENSTIVSIASHAAGLESVTCSNRKTYGI